MSIFAIGTLFAGIAPDFSMLLFERVIQSRGAGVMLPLMQTVFLMIFPVHRRGVLVLFIFRQFCLETSKLEFQVFRYSIFPLTVFIGTITFMGQNRPNRSWWGGSLTKENQIENGFYWWYGKVNVYVESGR
ncbi:hypothetical protein SAMN04488112_11383 [Melghirimyces thermohalophilus]|uniref:Uncharacterized protein n=1 Tax=Melghirimyces thermohalophilus TaxID=1236220 RepID=A0A1G6NLU1_9BACL|nr:hypothetical protein SAMN04488112_11383 [Melghirimyces thermohalophilus]